MGVSESDFSNKFILCFSVFATDGYTITTTDLRVPEMETNSPNEAKAWQLVYNGRF
jgi:hypothetical protein